MYDYYDYTTSFYDTGSSLGGMFAGLGTIMLISAIPSILMIISLWKIFKKAGKPGWASIVPIYNVIVLLQITELPLWYIVLLILPFANIYALFKIYIELAHKFGKSTGFGVACVFFGIICLPILAFSKDCVYNGTGGETAAPMPTPEVNQNTGDFNNQNFNTEMNNNVADQINNTVVPTATTGFQEPTGDLSVNQVSNIQTPEVSTPSVQMPTETPVEAPSAAPIETPTVAPVETPSVQVPNAVPVETPNVASVETPTVEVSNAAPVEGQSNVKQCPKCGKVHPSTMFFCDNCGQQL